MRLKGIYPGFLLGLVLAVTWAPDAFAQEANDSLVYDSTIVDSTIVDSTMVDSTGIIQESSNFFKRNTANLSTRFKKSALLVTILYMVIIYSIITLITLLTIILLNRRRLEREEVLKDYLLEKYQQLLMNYLFEEEKRETAFKELSRIADNRINRQMLIDQMIDLSVNLKGEIKEDIQELFLRLGLKRDSLEKAYSRKWHQNVKGYRELAYMNIRDANEKIAKSLNSNNEILRMEAQIAMVRLSDGNPYEFLHLIKKPLSLWEQVTLHELQIQHNLEIPDYKQWFGSANKSVTCLKSIIVK